MAHSADKDAPATQTHEGVVFGIGHPGPGPIGCPYCIATLQMPAVPRVIPPEVGQA